MKIVVPLTAALSLLLPTGEALGITTFKGKACKGGVLKDFKQSVDGHQCMNTPAKPMSIQIYKNYVPFDNLQLRIWKGANCASDTFFTYSFPEQAGYHCYNGEEGGIGSFQWFR